MKIKRLDDLNAHDAANLFAKGFDRDGAFDFEASVIASQPSRRLSGPIAKEAARLTQN